MLIVYYDQIGDSSAESSQNLPSCEEVNKYVCSGIIALQKIKPGKMEKAFEQRLKRRKRGVMQISEGIGL